MGYVIAGGIIYINTRLCARLIGHYASGSIDV